nr:patatin family protein [Dethiosulfatibacter aminovorans]
MEKTGLVLEGGGFRGIYSAGILDYFLERDIRFPYVIGVSMGACNGTNYVSKQVGRNLRVPYNYINDRRYISFYNLIFKGGLFGMDFVFGEIPRKLDVFDWKTYEESDQRFIVVATDCRTGKPEYFEKGKMDDLLEVLKASSSLPFISDMITINGKSYLDGGMSDSIPVRKALEDGNEKLVVILTRPEGYEKKPSSMGFLTRIKYGKYPELINCIENRYREYNETLDYVKRLESEGKAFVIRPVESLDMGRVERNRDKLKATYYLGYRDAEAIEDELLEFLR